MLIHLTTLFFTILRVYGLTGVELAQSDDCGYIEKIPGDLRTQSPWTAAIYHRNRYLVSGVVIGPTTVLTIFGGIYGAPVPHLRGNKTRYVLPKPENSFVGLGLKSLDLSFKDQFTQISPVNYILPYEGQEDENKEYHFVIYRLKKPLNLTTPYVKPLCLPFILRGMEEEGSPGGPKPAVQNSGFLKQNMTTMLDHGSPLKITNLTSLPHTECESAFQLHYGGDGRHVFCAKMNDLHPPTTKNVSCLSHGSAATFSIYDRHYLSGLLVLIPSKRRRGGHHHCGSNDLYFYGRVLEHLNWLRFNVRCSPEEFPCFRSGKCIPVHLACTLFDDCPDSSDENPVFCNAHNRCSFPSSPSSQEKGYMCGIQGGCLPMQKVCDNSTDCEFGQDESPKLCSGPSTSTASSVVTQSSTPMTLIDLNLSLNKNHGKEDKNIDKKNSCIPLPVSEGVEFTCRNPVTSEIINCTHAPTNTIVVGKCVEYYVSKYRQTSIRMVCGEDGLWAVYRPFACEANCGIISSGVDAFISNGKATTRNIAFPWYGALFSWEESTNSFKFICGASLIEKRVLVTAAHCLIRPNEPPLPTTIIGEEGTQVAKGQFKIVLAPLSSIFEENLEDQLATVFDVIRIWVPPNYDKKTLMADIALVEVEKPIKYGKFVRPVCYLAQSKLGVENAGFEERIAKVPGFGYTEADELSSFLQFANIPIVSSDKCAAPPGTFCGGPSLNGSALCLGDSGGGVVLTEKKSTSVTTKYILKGVVSTGQVREGGGREIKKCDVENFSIFTHVQSYLNWIVEKLEMIEDE